MDGASHIHQHSHPDQHDHGHVHVHDHGHSHAHRHDHAAPARAPASLLRMSAGERLALAGGAVAAIWMGVFWAIGA